MGKSVDWLDVWRLGIGQGADAAAARVAQGLGSIRWVEDRGNGQSAMGNGEDPRDGAADPFGDRPEAVPGLSALLSDPRYREGIRRSADELQPSEVLLPRDEPGIAQTFLEMCFGCLVESPGGVESPAFAGEGVGVDRAGTLRGEGRGLKQGIRPLVAVSGDEHGRQGEAAFYRWDGERWDTVLDEDIREMIGSWAQRVPLFEVVAGNAKRGTAETGELKRWLPSSRLVRDLVNRVRDEVTVPRPAGAERMWLRATHEEAPRSHGGHGVGDGWADDASVDREGAFGVDHAAAPGRRPGTQTSPLRPVYGRRRWERLDPAPPCSASSLLLLRDRAIDLDAWDRGELVSIAKTPRLFATGALELDVSDDDLREVLAITSEPISAGEQVPALLSMFEPECGDYIEAMRWSWDAEELPEPFAEKAAEWLKVIGYWLRDERHRQFGNVVAFNGPSGSGKGTLFAPVKKLLGPVSVAYTFDQLGDDRYIVGWRGKHLAYNEEARIGGKTDKDAALGMILSVTGGGTIATRALFNAAQFDRPIAGRIFMAFKRLPQFRGAEDLERRMLLFDFPRRRLEGVDERLEERICAPASLGGILLLALAGRRWLSAEGFRQPGDSQMVLGTFFEAATLLDREFCEEWLRVWRPGEFEDRGGGVVVRAEDVWTSKEDLAEAAACFLVSKGKMRGAPDRGRLKEEVLNAIRHYSAWRGREGQPMMLADDGTKHRVRSWNMVELTEKARGAMEAVGGKAADGGMW